MRFLLKKEENNQGGVEREKEVKPHPKRSKTEASKTLPLITA
jgi:hypothetical protein